MEDSADISLESRHRKERKELQAHIQSLKKAAKNDKSKKKELFAEILRLESDLETRQKEELNSQEPVNIPILQENVDEINENEPTKGKISKAQKRRDKKLQQEKQRDEEIKLQEKENAHGPRNLELLSITTKLKEKNLKLYQIPSDGDCLYKAISHQMLLNRQKTISVEELRKGVSDYIKENKDDFLPFMSNPDTFETLNESEFEEYCAKIVSSKVWGGQLELRALSNILKCSISVIQATGPDSIEQGTEFDGPPLILTYHRHMYSLGEHYNSTELLNE